MPIVRLIVDDFRRREVSVWWLVAMAVCSAGVAVSIGGWREVMIQCGINLLLIIYMGVGVTAWAWIKSRRPINPVNRYIGLGDVLFFVALTPLFPLKQFAWLMVMCLVFSLAWWQIKIILAKKKASGKSPKNIPFVATSGIVICAAIIFNVIIK
jgi:cbb3-type cytochrome oxidase subunit 3